MTHRLDRLRAAMNAVGADAVIVSHSANRQYFSGYPAIDLAPDETNGILLVGEGTATLVVSPTNLGWAEGTARPDVRVLPWERPWQRFLAKLITDLGAPKLAFEDRALTVADYRALAQELPHVELIPAGNAFHALRLVKDDAELELIAAAAKVTDAAFQAATANIEPGITERQLAWELDVAMRRNGSHGPAFPTCVASGPHSAHPHHDSSDRPIGPGEPIVIDMGATIDGYCADLTRTIVLGDPPSAFRERYNVVLQAQLASLSAIHAGMTGAQADAIARDAIASAGYGDDFVHGIGHGVGLLVHEGPSLNATSDDQLEPGHVITIEPGIYLEGWGGIRIEDLAAVTANGLNVLSSAPK